MIDGLMIGMLGYEERFVGSHVMDYRGNMDVAPTCLCFFRYDVVQCSTFVWLLGIETFSSRSSVLDEVFQIIAAFLQLPVFFSLRRFFMSLCILEDVVFFCRRREPLSAMLMYTWAGRNVGSGRFLVGLKGRYVWRRACKMKACSLNGRSSCSPVAVPERHN